MGRQERNTGYRALGHKYKIHDMEKKDWDDNEFTERIRITKEDRDYIKRVKGKTSMARKLQEIIKKYKNGSAQI